MLAKSKVEFIVEGTPDVVLEMIRGFLESDEWLPYPAERGRNFLHKYRRPRPVVTRLDDPIKGRNKVVASILFGFIKQVSVTAIGDEPGWTKLTVEATKPEHAETLAAWIQRELIENRAAAR